MNTNKMDVWKNTIVEMEIQGNKTNSFLIELINYQYGYIEWCLSKNRKKEAKQYLELAEKNIDYLNKQEFNHPLTHLYKSAFLDLK